MSVLYIVATPIGNLGDITRRAVETLASVDVIAAEDTRRTGILLNHLGISGKLVAFHAHNEDQQESRILDLLAAGQSVALVSDAGTPLIADPGFALVRSAREAGCQVVTIPGPSSVIAALSIAGLPSTRFSFEGFVPAKEKARLAFFQEMVLQPRTVICFETPHRLAASLDSLAACIEPSRRIAVCRELTKTYEQVLGGPVAELIEAVRDGSLPEKGEIVLLISPAADEGIARPDAERLVRALMEELPPSRAAAVAARVLGVPRRELYDVARHLASLENPEDKV